MLIPDFMKIHPLVEKIIKSRPHEYGLDGDTECDIYAKIIIVSTKLNGATIRSHVNIQHNENLKTSYKDKIIDCNCE